MGRKKNKPKKTNVFDVNHVKTTLDDCLIKFVKKQIGAIGKEDKFFKYLKIFLCAVCVGAQAFAYKGTKNHWVVGGICVLYYVLTRSIDLLNRFVIGNTIFVSNRYGKKRMGSNKSVVRIETSFKELFSPVFILEIFFSEDAKDQGMFKKFSFKGRSASRTIKVNNYFNKKGYFHEKKFKEKVIPMINEALKGEKEKKKA